MRALVTGAAGFIGSNLVDQLLADGWQVRGADCFTPYYARNLKETNIRQARAHHGFEFVDLDLSTAELGPLLEGVDIVFHQAAQPGVRLSWADGFHTYNELNVNLTQRLLEVARGSTISRFVYASSSSIYGQTHRWPTAETDDKRPHSPYGVTKLAGELLCGAYATNFGVPTVALRYFTVYGPRQRPDMATHRLIEAARRGTPFPLYGDGQQVRDFTFVADVVDANVRAATSEVAAGTVMNIAGGSSTRLVDLVDLVGNTVGQRVPVEWLEAQPGDVARTGGLVDLAADTLGWSPRVSLEVGVQRQVAWHLSAFPI